MGAHAVFFCSGHGGRCFCTIRGCLSGCTGGWEFGHAQCNQWLVHNTVVRSLPSLSRASTNVTPPALRGALLSSVVAGAALTLPNGASAEMPLADAGVSIEDSPMMQAMLQQSGEQRDERKTELLNKYN